EAGGGGVAAVAHEQVLRAAQRLVQVEAADGAGRAAADGALAVAVERDAQGGAAEAIDQLGGDDADDARVPAGAGGDDDTVGLGLGLLHGLDHDTLLDGATFDI